MDMTPAIDVEQARRDTLGVAGVAPLKKPGAALPPPQVTKAVIAHLRQAEAMGGYETAAAAHGHSLYLSNARLTVAHFDEIVAVENARPPLQLRQRAAPAGQRLTASSPR